MATATKRAMTINGKNTGDGYGKEHYNWREGDDGGNGPWFVCEFLCVWRDHKK
jgi:hypothetical protein